MSVRGLELNPVNLKGISLLADEAQDCLSIETFVSGDSLLLVTPDSFVNGVHLRAYGIGDGGDCARSMFLKMRKHFV